jgi:hypothetical protein
VRVQERWRIVVAAVGEVEEGENTVVTGMPIAIIAAASRVPTTAAAYFNNNNNSQWEYVSTPKQRLLLRLVRGVKMEVMIIINANNNISNCRGRGIWMRVTDRVAVVVVFPVVNHTTAKMTVMFRVEEGGRIPMNYSTVCWGRVLTRFDHRLT